jgi:WTAP/Mum2p family
VNALIQRSRLLQEENDELYEILKVKETGKLKEEARGLRRVVQRLESGLRGAFPEAVIGIPTYLML